MVSADVWNCEKMVKEIDQNAFVKMDGTHLICSLRMAQIS
jgi:hypothetical protein